MAITILIHSSKTMRSARATAPTTTPQLMDKVVSLAAYVRALTPSKLQAVMKISEPLSRKVHDAFAVWNINNGQGNLAIDSFVGDIYSGLRATELSQDDRDYAQQSLRILSGLYGILRPYDSVQPYRLEMGYKLPSQPYSNLYSYWGSEIAEMLPKDGLIVNLSAAEYTRTVIPYIDTSRVVAPRFLTISPKTGVPSQVIVHTKIARGAFARWLLISRTTVPDEMVHFNDLNYHYDAELSTPLEPTFVCNSFGGIGLSVRLLK